MVIRNALASDFDEASCFFDMMCQEIGKKDFMPNGNKGGFPSKEMILSAIENEQLYIGEEDNQIVAAYILNHDADDAYDTVTWSVDASKNQISILHALRVHPAYTGKGYATRLLEHSIETAIAKNQAAIRLDCLDDNMIPAKMYQSHGFQYIDTVEIFYEDIGEPRKCLLFERIL